MRHDEAPEVVDLDRYKAAHAQAQAQKKAREEAQAKLARRARRMNSGQSLLGSRPKAGLILAAVLLGAAALVLLPRFL